jgi:hypothetical protein
MVKGGVACRGVHNQLDFQNHSYTRCRENPSFLPCISGKIVTYMGILIIIKTMKTLEENIGWLLEKIR